MLFSLLLSREKIFFMVEACVHEFVSRRKRGMVDLRVLNERI